MSSKSFLKALSLLSACLAPVAAQTWTACNPMNGTCPDNPALGMVYNYDFSDANNASTWNATSGAVKYGAQGGEFTINKRFDSPTIQSEFYIMFGVVEVHMQAAVGQGVISSIVLESDDLDEVDWEFMGGNNTHAETNYFGKGNTTLYNRAIYYPVNKPLDSVHNYTVHWTKDVIEWYIDTNLVRTLKYQDALNGYNFPQTPMNIRLGIWAGGDPGNNNGTIEWAGGLTDFKKGPYTMFIQSIRVQDFGTGKAYHWADKTGSFESIKSVVGNSTAAQTLTAVPKVTLTTAQKWNNLSPTVRIGIYAAAGAFTAALAGLITFCCIKQRRAGRREQAAAAKLEQDRLAAESIPLDTKHPDALPLSATPDQYNGVGEALYEKPGAFGSKEPMPSPTSVHAGLNSGSPFNGPFNGARSPPPTGPLPIPGGFNPNTSPYGENAAMQRNGPGSMRSNPGNGPPMLGGGPGSVRSNHTGPPGGFSDFAPSRSASAGPGSPRGFPLNNNFDSGNAPRLGNGPGSMRSFTAPGGYNGPFNGNGNGPSSNYGDGGLRSPSVPIGYADGGIRSPGPNYSHPGNFSPRAMSPRIPQSPNMYGPGPGQQFAGSSGGNYFNGGGQGGYARPGAF